MIEMKKTTLFIFSLLLMGMMAIGVAADCTTYKGMPTPYTIKGHVDLTGELVGGVKVIITNKATGCIQQLTTNEQGFFVTDISNLGTSDPRRSPGQYGDVIRAELDAECGENDVCVLEQEVYGEGNDYDMTFDFDLETTKFPYLEVTVTAIIAALLGVVAWILARFKWGKGFAGLITYYTKKGDEARKAGRNKEAKKYYDRATKMAKTAIANAKAGKYDK